MSTDREVVMDWEQVRLNGGPPCFYVEGPQFCGRAERWGGHGNPAFHEYVSLSDLLTTARAEQAERNAAQERLNNAVMYALREGCFSPVPEPRKGATTEELIKWGAMRSLHDAIAEFNRTAAKEGK